jgi:hypothetical protein
MTREELVRELRTALADEREAIRRLDTELLGKATAAKESVLETVTGASPEDRAAYAEALAELKDDVVRNLVLLAHARDYLRDAIQIFTGPRPRLDAKL